jgi:arabinofuranosyltransferase
MTGDAARRSLVPPLLLAGIAALLLAHAARLWLMCDDAYITFRYARSLAEGLGPVYNVGERVEGYTSPLWMLLLAIGMRARVPPESAATALGVLCGLGTLAVAYAAGRRLAPDRSPLAALIAPLFLATHRTFAGWTTGGLETSLFTFLVATAFHRLWIEVGAPSPARSPGESIARGSALLRRRKDTDALRPWSGGLFALALLTRPEGALFFVVAFAVRFALRAAARQSPTRRDVLWLALAIVPAAAHETFRLAYYGDWLPNTFYAKVPGAWFGLGSTYLAAFALETALPASLAIALVGIARAETPATRRTLALACLAPLPYVIYVAAVGGDHFEYRFLHVALPFLALVTARGAWAAARVFRPGPPRVAAAVGIALLLVALQNAIPWSVTTRDPETLVAGTRRLVDPRAAPARFLAIVGLSPWLRSFDRATAELARHEAALCIEEHRRVARELLDQGARLRDAIRGGLLYPSDRIALATAGIVPYVTRLPTFDIKGLTRREIAHRPISGPLRTLAHDKTATIEDAAQWGADFVAVHSAGFLLTEPELRAAAALLRDRTIYAAPWRDGYFVFEPARTAPTRLAARFAARGASLFAIDHGRVASVPVAAGETP